MAPILWRRARRSPDNDGRAGGAVADAERLLGLPASEQQQRQHGDVDDNMPQQKPFLVQHARPSTPTTTVATAATAALVARAATTTIVAVETSTIPATYGSAPSGPDAGTVVGITLGAVGGFLLLMALLYTCVNFGGGGGVFLGGPGAASVVEVETASSFGGTASFISRRSVRRERELPRRHRHHHHHHHRPRGERETVEIRTSGSRRARPIIVDEPGERVERVVVEEERRRSGRPPPGVAVVESVDDDEIVVEEETVGRDRRRAPPPQRRRDEVVDDEVVVIEENSSPPPRRDSRRRRDSRDWDSAGPSRRSSRRGSGSRR